MEAREGVLGSGGVRVVGTDAPANYHIAPRTENPVHIAGSDPAPAAPLQVGLSPATFLSVRKKRGRPRKYGPDGSVTMALSPKPISSSAPPSVIDFSAGKRGKFRPASETSRPRMEMENMGEWGACSVGASFTPHMITVNTGEDITMKVISFSQQGPRAICILSANGVISSVTLRQADSSGGTLTYEGRFEILSLTGSFMPTETGGTRNRSGGMSVSLASPDGRVVGGGVAGLLVAASPVQIVIGSFLTGNQHSQNAKKQKPENFPAAIPAAPMSSAETNEHYVQRAAAISNPNLSSSSFKWSSVPSDSRNNPTDINVSLQAG